MNRERILSEIGLQFEPLDDRSLNLVYISLTADIKSHTLQYWESFMNTKYYREPILPKEILKLIILNLTNIYDIVSLYSTSKDFHSILTNKIFLKDLYSQISTKLVPYISDGDDEVKIKKFKHLVSNYRNKFYTPNARLDTVVMFSGALSNGYDVEHLLPDLKVALEGDLNCNIFYLPISHFQYIIELGMLVDKFNEKFVRQLVGNLTPFSINNMEEDVKTLKSILSHIDEVSSQLFLLDEVAMVIGMSTIVFELVSNLIEDRSQINSKLIKMSYHHVDIKWISIMMKNLDYEEDIEFRKSLLSHILNDIVRGSTYNYCKLEKIKCLISSENKLTKDDIRLIIRPIRSGVKEIDTYLQSY